MDRHAMVRSLRPPMADAVLAACVALAGQLEVWLLAEVDAAVAAPLVLLSAVALAWRRRAPLAAVTVVMGVETATALAGVPIDSLVVVIPVIALAIYSVAAHATAARALIGLGVALAGIWIVTFDADGPGVDNLMFGLVVAGGPWLAGWHVRRRTHQAVELALSAQELERTQAEREEAAVARERTRIARELHDIIAHSVSVMTIQAGAVEEVLDTDPAKARAAAGSIRETGRQALVDLRRLLGLLREQDPTAARLSPQPGLDDLEALLDQVRGAGVDVRLDVEGVPRTLPSAVDLSAFRLVQEALTNTLKHARASTAVVEVRYTPDALHIEVVDDGVARNGTGKGHGLIGMQERIALYGGQLEYGSRPTGGFRVHALLPVQGETV
jgi:signal transduction histidine kinase